MAFINWKKSILELMEGTWKEFMVETEEETGNEFGRIRGRILYERIWK